MIELVGSWKAEMLKEIDAALEYVVCDGEQFQCAVWGYEENKFGAVSLPRWAVSDFAQGVREGCAEAADKSDYDIAAFMAGIHALTEEGDYEQGEDVPEIWTVDISEMDMVGIYSYVYVCTRRCIPLVLYRRPSSTLASAA